MTHGIFFVLIHSCCTSGTICVTTKVHITCRKTSQAHLLAVSPGSLQRASANPLMMYTPNRLRASPERGIPRHVPGTRPGEGAMRTSGGRPNLETHRPIGINPKKLRVLTSEEQNDSSDGLANYPSRDEGVARCLNGTSSRNLSRNRQRQKKVSVGT